MSELPLTVTRSIVDPAHGLLLRMPMCFGRASIGFGIGRQRHLLHQRQPVFVEDMRLEEIGGDLLDATNEAAAPIDEACVVGIHGLGVDQ